MERLGVRKREPRKKNSIHRNANNIDRPWTSALTVQAQWQRLVNALPNGVQKQLLAERLGMQASSLTHPPFTHVADTVASVSSPNTVTTQLLSEFLELKAMMQQSYSGKPKWKLQSLRLNAEWQNWTFPEGWKDRLRKDFPFDAPEVDLSELRNYMAGLHLDEDTINKAELAMARFCGMVETVDGSKLDVSNVLVNAAESGIFPDLRTMDLCSSGYSCTLAMVVAMGHFAVMCKIRYQSITHDANAANIMDNLINNILKPWDKLCRKEANKSKKRKFQRDAKLLQDHSKDKLRDITRECYFRMITIHDWIVTQGKPSNAALLFKATANAITPLYTNTQPSRSMELEKMSAQIILDFLADPNSEHVEIKDYKTIDTYAEGGHWLHKGECICYLLISDMCSFAPHRHAVRMGSRSL